MTHADIEAEAWNKAEEEKKQRGQNF